MIKMFLFFSGMTLVTASWAVATELPVPFQSTHLQQQSTELGELELDGMGKIQFSARKNQGQLVIFAYDASGNTIGKSDSLPGMKETPIYVKTPNGLKKINIIWGMGNR